LESGFQGTVIENRSGPIEILVSSLGYSEVKIAIQAHPDLVTLRNELYDAEES
jgi:sRNA-binding carbon storage regulator CsrA